uniref:Uncharacterized protein n=1 Tax=Oryzias latipes TaxID=8090 RepID=A0A3P9LU29_ORYLA
TNASLSPTPTNTSLSYFFKYFPVNRGVRQRCPMRPLLFIISVELLAILLKYSPDFEGINILDREFKIIMIEKV